MVKIDEVAAAAGVSISTVSYALSGKRPVSPDTRRRIEEAARGLGYSPNAGARMLAGGRTHIFALTEPLRTDTHAPTHMAFVLATAVAARRHGYDILLLTEEEAQAGMSRVAATGLADGIVVLDVAPDDPRAALARAIGTPSVFIGVPTDHEGLVCVDLDFEAAATLAVDRLADAGHTALGLLGQSKAAYARSNFAPRVRDAARAQATERGAALDVRTTGATVADGAAARRSVRELLDAGVTGLILHCTPEAHAAALDELAAAGRDVPGDVSVIAVGAGPEIDGAARAVDTIPLVPQQSCDLAVALLLETASGGIPSPGLHLIDPVYRAHGSVASLHD